MSVGERPPTRAISATERFLVPARLVFGAGVVLLALYFVRVFTGFGGSSAQRLFATWISDAIVLSAATVSLWRAAVDRPVRAVWGLVGLGMISWGLGNAYWEHSLTAGISLPNPSPADLGFLGFYPLMYLAILAARRREGGRLGVGQWVDGLIGAAACTTLAGALVLEPVVDGTKGESVIGALTNIAYPIGDLTLLMMIVVTTATVGWRTARGPLLLGLVLFAVSDSLYIVQNAEGTYHPGGVLDAGWLVALMLMALGALTARRDLLAPMKRRLVSQRAVLPSLAGLVALVVLGLAPFFKVPTVSLVFAILTLVLVVGRLAGSLRETAELLAARAREAELDPLTGLGNRRLLLSELKRQAADADAEDPLLLVLFDLDGFKIYNDTFGHNAGDSILIQVAEGLQGAVGVRGRAYRIGGDEFCALLSPGNESYDHVAHKLAAAMSLQSEGISVTASYGCASAPGDGRETTALMRRADDEMYERKGRRRPGTENQVEDALIAALDARQPGLESHTAAVTSLAASLGRRLRVDATDQRALVHAAALHDVGKIFLPDAIVEKPTALDADEQRLFETHPLIAQRIISAAPALGYTAQIVRSVHERWDGRGYPDKLRGEAIPLPARIVSVCNAYQEMIDGQRHRRAVSSQQAIAELQRRAGAQFDPTVVTAFVDVLAHVPEHPARGHRVAVQAPEPPVAGEVSDRRRLEAQVSYQAEHDLLTGLFNRRRFAEELERMLRYGSRYGRGGALLTLDVDNLKLINDVHGHAAGDAALKIVAREMQRRTRSTDIAARLGGDEFAIALHEADERAALSVAEDMRAHLAECEMDPSLQISVGVALFDRPEELVADDLLTAADIALYEAKQAGRDQARVYRGGPGPALGWVQRIRNALAEGRFVLYGQPIIDLRNGRVSHRELLVRMLSDDLDVIPPDSFIPTAERFGLVNDIDRWVTREGLSLARRGERVSINLSAHSFGDPRIVDGVRVAVDEGLHRGSVIFEITETAAMSNIQDARSFIEELNGLGCEVALDDFGTGFGSFSYLKHLPTRFLKIDIEFVRELVSNPTDQQVVRSITEIGHSLGKLIIAEGVENRPIEQALRKYGVDYAQGVFIGAPERISPPTRFEEQLRSRRQQPAAKRRRGTSRLARELPLRRGEPESARADASREPLSDA